MKYFRGVRKMGRILFLVVFLFAGPAAAATLTWEGGVYDINPGCCSTAYTENGIHVTGEDNGLNVESHVHRGYSEHIHHITLVNGGRFAAEKIDVFSNAYYTIEHSDGSSTPCGLACRNVSLTGFRDGLAIAGTVISSELNGTYSFGSDFSDLDRLVLAYDLQPLVGAPSGASINANEFHFDYDNLQLSPAPAPVPLPASIWLFGVALLGMGVLKRRHA